MKNIMHIALIASLCLAALAVGAGLSAQAAVINVITADTIGATGTTADGAIFTGIDPQSTGTGVFEPFLREQNSPSELGVDTSIASPPFDDKAGIWTHDLAVSSLATVTVNGTKYYQFNLDANQSANADISLTKFQIFVTSSFATTVSQLNTIVAATPAFDMNDATHTYRVDVSSETGSGSGDLRVLVPESAIGTTGDLYLFAGFGTDANGGGFASNDGFEEWNAVEGANFTIPDASSTLSLLGFGLLGFEALRRKGLSDR